MSGKMVPQSWTFLPLLPNPCLELPPQGGGLSYPLCCLLQALHSRGSHARPGLAASSTARPPPCLPQARNATGGSGQPWGRRGGSQVRVGLGAGQCWAPSSFRVCPWTAGEVTAGEQGEAAFSPHCDPAGPRGPRPGQKRWGRLLLPLCPLGRPSSCCYDVCGPYPRVVSLT